MPSHSLMPSRRAWFARLVASQLILAACSSEGGSPPNQGDHVSTMHTSAGASAAQPSAAKASAAEDKAERGASMTAGGSSAAPSSPTTPSTPAGQQPMQNMPQAKAMDPMDMADPMDPTTALDPGDAVQLPVDMGTPTLYWLDIAGGTVTTANADGSNDSVVARGSPLSAPDGVTIDPEGKHFFVLNMGTVIGGGNRGSLVRYNLDGSDPEVIMPPGSKAGDVTFNTGKQVTIDRVNKKLYMGDREGSKVWRVDYDGKNLEVLISGHGVQQIVGVGADPTERHFYFSDRNGKKLFRAGMDMPAGQTHADRDDVELIYVEKAATAMPLDIELDLEHRMIYWTDRTQGKVLGMHMDMPMGETAEDRSDVELIADGLTEAIGLAYDHQESTLFVTHAGTVSSVKTDGTGLKRIGSSGNTGISFARIQQ